jgi:ketosteroid isomerase-like protein
MKNKFTKHVHKLICACLAFSIIGCSPSDKTSKEQEFKQIDEIYTKMSLAYRTFDVKLMEEVYTQDAYSIYAPGKDTLTRGLKNFISGFQSTFDYHKERGNLLELKFKIVERRIDRTLGYDIGYFKIDTINKQGERTGGKPGRFVTILAKQENGSWRFQVDIYGDALESAF